MQTRPSPAVILPSAPLRARLRFRTARTPPGRSKFCVEVRVFVQARCRARFGLHQTPDDMEVVHPIYPRLCVRVIERGAGVVTWFAGCCTDAKGVGIEQALFGANYGVRQHKAERPGDGAFSGLVLCGGLVPERCGARCVAALQTTKAAGIAARPDNSAFSNWWLHRGSGLQAGECWSHSFTCLFRPDQPCHVAKNWILRALLENYGTVAAQQGFLGQPDQAYLPGLG